MARQDGLPSGPNSSLGSQSRSCARSRASACSRFFLASGSLSAHFRGSASVRGSTLTTRDVLHSESMVESAMIGLIMRRLVRTLPGSGVAGQRLRKSAGSSFKPRFHTIILAVTCAGWCTWKEIVFDGHCDHYATKRSSGVLEPRREATQARARSAEFKSLESFRPLRLPFCRAVSAERHPDNGGAICSYIDAMSANRRWPISGDISQWNLLIGQDWKSASAYEVGHQHDPRLKRPPR